MVYVGMDVHSKRTQVAIMKEDGTEMLNRNVPNDPSELSPVLGSLEPGTPVVFEAAYGWGWLAELLDDWGLEPHLAHAKGCKAIASARLKNDRSTHARLPTCCAPICWRRRGSRPGRCATFAPCFVTVHP